MTSLTHQLMLTWTLLVMYRWLPVWAWIRPDTSRWLLVRPWLLILMTMRTICE